MKIIEVPILNEDGSIQYTATLTEEEHIRLLQFAINLSASVGLGAHQRYTAHKVKDEDDFPEGFEGSPSLND